MTFGAPEGADHRLRNAARLD